MTKKLPPTSRFLCGIGRKYGRHVLHTFRLFCLSDFMSYYWSFNTWSSLFWHSWFCSFLNCIIYSSVCTKNCTWTLSFWNPLISEILFATFICEYSEKAMAPHSSIPAWKIPWTEEPGRLQSMGSLRVKHDWATSLFTSMHSRRKWQPTPVFLPGESQGWRSLVGCCLWGRTE